MEDANTSGENFWRRLLHRWFVQYNPSYLVSAALCIAGLRLTSRGLGAQGSVVGDLTIAAITDIYALAMIVGAALLMRLGQRRPAVTLALLAALYQGDLSLHTEACIFLGATGIVASTMWIAVFVAKLYALAWAVKLRPSRSAIGLASYAAIGLALIPQVISRMHGGPRNAIVTLWVFSVAAIGINVSRGVVSTVDLSAWARTVLVRSLRLAWLLWSAALMLHVVFWSANLSVSLAALVPAALLVATRFMRSEARVWAATTALLAIVAITAPHLFAITALMSAATFALRAWRHLQQTASSQTAHSAPPFRAENVDPTVTIALPAWDLAPAPPAMRQRLLVGSLFAGYLAMWTVDWQGGPWPSHVLALDLALVAVVLFLVAKMRVRIALPPLAASFGHLLIQTHVVTAPRTLLTWGVLSTGVAFALLFASLATSYWLRDVDPGRGDALRKSGNA